MKKGDALSSARQAARLKTKPQREPLPQPSFEGYLDSANWMLVSGWARFPAEPNRFATVDVFVDNVFLVSVSADRYRADLVGAGKGNGRHGFALSIPRLICAAPIMQLAVRDHTTGRDLAGSPTVLINEEAGLDASSKAFLTRRVEALDGSASLESLDAHAVFLLGLFDQVMDVRAKAAVNREDETAQWSKIFAASPSGSLIGRLADVVQHQYGDRILCLPTSDVPVVSVIIPAHGNFWYTHQCLTRIAQHRPSVPFEVILVDDRSTDETVLVSMIVEGLRVLRNERNLGFVGSVNAGAGIAKGKFLLLLNNDTEVQAGWLDELYDTLDCDQQIGIVGSKLLFPNGVLQECGGIIWRLGDGWNYGRDLDPNMPEFRYMRDVDYVSGAALMIRRVVWDEVGGLSEEYAPAYYEDVDLCFKARAAGHRVVVQPASVVLHHEGISAGRDVAGTGMKRYQRMNMERFRARWETTLAAHAIAGTELPSSEAERGVRRRALFVDNSVPTPDRDAGSNVAMESMKSLIRLGYQTHFVPSDNMARIAPYTEALERIGIRCHTAPYQRSVEEVLRMFAGAFQLICLHRVSNVQYMAVARAHNPEAQIVYSVCDLHHLRMTRQAAFAPQPGLLQKAKAIRAEELSAVAAADVTIVHSTVEAELLRIDFPAANILMMPWVVRPRPVTAPFADRAGLAFVGSLHPPNVDAAEWLLRAIMPLVWRHSPGITLHLIGDHTTAPKIQSLIAPLVRKGSVVSVGWIADLSGALAGRRLTAAPLRFGAGLKGKVIDSIAMGLPCVATSCAMEGAQMPPLLLKMVTDQPAEFAARVLACHDDRAANAALAEAGLDYVRANCSEARIDILLAGALQRETAGRQAQALPMKLAARKTLSRQRFRTKPA